MFIVQDKAGQELWVPCPSLGHAGAPALGLKHRTATPQHLLPRQSSAVCAPRHCQGMDPGPLMLSVTGASCGWQ